MRLVFLIKNGILRALRMILIFGDYVWKFLSPVGIYCHLGTVELTTEWQLQLKIQDLKLEIK
jgi:hypothetical protein